MGGNIVIYIVEDEQNIRELVMYALENNKTPLPAKGFESSKAFEKAMAEELPDLVIFDVMLPGKDGLTLTKEMRENPKTAHIPILILSAKSNEYDKVQGLDNGADDYLAKPFSPMELVARVKALLRRSNNDSSKSSSSGDTKEMGSLVHLPGSKEFMLDNQVVDLTHKEYQLLEYFIQNHNIALTRDQILNAIWGYDYDGESRTVDVHVSSLKKKLGDFGSECIVTKRSTGYMFKVK